MTLKISFSSTFFALIIVFLVVGSLYSTPWCRRVEKILPFLLAYPHAAFSTGIVLLIAPSGIVFRMLSNFIPGLEQPPAIISYQDSRGYSLILGLILKEIPFLLFMTLSSLNQINTKAYHQIARTMGYSSFKIWSKLIWPQVYNHLRLPILIILSFSASTVDMTYILGPSSPPPLVRLILEWFQNEDLSYQAVASSGSIFFLVLLLGSMVVWRLGEKFFRSISSLGYSNGKRGVDRKLMPQLSSTFLIFLFFIFFSTLAINLIWSCSKRWSYPFLIPQSITFKYWAHIFEPNFLITLINSLGIAVIASSLSLILVVILFENNPTMGNHLAVKSNLTKRKTFQYSSYLTFLIYLPLFLPQIILLLGVQVFLLYLLPTNQLSFYLKVIWAHFLFVFPYVYLTLSGAYHNYDQRYTHLAQTFSKKKWRILWKIKWPMLLKPLLFSISIGFSVSFMDYLATAIMGSGRIETITTETVHLGVGGNRRLSGLYSTLQMIFPFFVFLISVILSHRLDRPRGKIIPPLYPTTSGTKKR